MTRTVNESAHAERRTAFLDAAERLIATRGYGRMTIQDVLNDVGASKGAFYHYFDSKQALLEGLVDRSAAVAQATLAEYADDPRLTALDKLRGFFVDAGQSKAKEAHLWLGAASAWYSDDNAALRQRVRAKAVGRLAPALTRIIQQGVSEGVFTTAYVDRAAWIVFGLLTDLDDTLGRRLLASPAADADPTDIAGIVAAYTDALERVLGAPSGSLVLVDVSELRAWLDAAHDRRSDETSFEPEGEQTWQGTLR